MSTPKITESDSRTGVSTKAPDHFAESIEKIYQKAKEQGLGDKWLARKLGTSQQNVNRWRRGKARPPDLTVESIAHKLDLHIEDLLSGRIADKPSRYGLPSIKKINNFYLTDAKPKFRP